MIMSKRKLIVCHYFRRRTKWFDALCW